MKKYLIAIIFILMLLLGAVGIDYSHFLTPSEKGLTIKQVSPKSQYFVSDTLVSDTIVYDTRDSIYHQDILRILRNMKNTEKFVKCNDIPDAHFDTLTYTLKPQYQMFKPNYISLLYYSDTLEKLSLHTISSEILYYFYEMDLCKAQELSWANSTRLSIIIFKDESSADRYLKLFSIEYKKYINERLNWDMKYTGPYELKYRFYKKGKMIVFVTKTHNSLCGINIHKKGYDCTKSLEHLLDFYIEQIQSE